MAVPGVRGEVPGYAAGEIFAVDAFRREFDARLAEVDPEGRRVVLERTAFYPGGGGQPYDVGILQWSGGEAAVTSVRRDGGRIWHTLDGPELPPPGADVHGQLDWGRRHLLMRTHTALHMLCGVIYAEFGVAVTGGNMEPGRGRLDFALDAVSADLGARLEARLNEEIAAAREIIVEFVGRGEADGDPALIRTAANLIPREIDPLRVIDILGLDKQADGGTHVASTADVRGIAITGTENKGRSNKRIRLEVRDS